MNYTKVYWCYQNHMFGHTNQLLISFKIRNSYIFIMNQYGCHDITKIFVFEFLVGEQWTCSEAVHHDLKVEPKNLKWYNFFLQHTGDWSLCWNREKEIVVAKNGLFIKCTMYRRRREATTEKETPKSAGPSPYLGATLTIDLPCMSSHERPA